MNAAARRVVPPVRHHAHHLVHHVMWRVVLAAVIIRCALSVPLRLEALNLIVVVLEHRAPECSYRLLRCKATPMRFNAP